MKHLLLVTLSITLASCSAFKPKKEYEFVLESGELASPQQVSEVKAICEYDKKIEEAKNNMGTAISVGRYESGYGPKTSDKYVKEASRLMYEARDCLLANGLSTREKKKP